MKTCVIFTSTTEHLLKNLKTKAENLEFIIPEKNKEGERFFPDGEIYMRLSRIKKLKGKRVIVLHSGAPNPNDGLIELKLVLQILKDHGIKPELFLTYFSYGQQDKTFELGETNVAEGLVKKFINYYGVKKIYIIDPHFGKMEWAKKYPIISVSAVQILLDKARQDFGENILFLSPDKGGKRRTGISGFNKKRINSYQVETFSTNINVKGKTIGVIDDLLETGGTLSRFCEVIIKSGAKEVFALITHGVLNSGIKRIKNKYSKVYMTNTINKKGVNVDITDLIINALESGNKIKKRHGK